MEIILQTRVPNLGKLGDKVKVKDGYARNYLLPKGYALSATPKNLEAFEAKRAELEKKLADELSLAEGRAAKLKGAVFTLEVQATEDGKLYGSVGTHEIMTLLRDAGHEVAKREVYLPNGQLRVLGAHPVVIQLHSDIHEEITVELVAIGVQSA